MIAHEAKLFSSSLGALQAPVVMREFGRERDQAREIEMAELAGGILPAFTKADQVTVSSSARDGYVLRIAGASQQDLLPAATALAAASGMSVTTLDVHGSRTITPPPMGVLLPPSFPNFNARDQLTQQLADILIRSVYPSADSGHNLTTPQEILQKYDLSFLAEIRPNNFGVQELVLGNDLSVLARPEFSQLLMDLKQFSDVTRVVVQPSTKGIEQHVHRALGGDFPWVLSLKADNSGYLIETDISKQSMEKEIRDVVQRFSAQIAAPVALALTPLLTGVWTRPPVSAAPGEPATFTVSGPDYLFARLDPPGKNSNIARLSLPFSFPSATMRSFIDRHLNTGSNFLNVVEVRQSATLPVEDYKSRLENLKQKLGEKGVTVVAGVDGVSIKLPGSVDVCDYNNLALFVEFVEATKILCKGRVMISRPDSAAEIFDFLSRSLGNENTWSFNWGSRELILESRSPRSLPSGLRDRVRTLFDKELRIERNPEPLAGREFSAPLRRDVAAPWEQVHAVFAQLESILPPGLGEQVHTRQEGNRIVIYSKTRNLPDVYLESLKRDLYGLPVPYVVREDFEATRADRPKVLRDIITRSLPEGIFLRQILRGSSGLRVVLSPEVESTILPAEVQEQILACSAEPIEFVYRPLGQNLEALLKNASDGTSRRFVASVVTTDNRLLSQKALKMQFLDHFEYSRKVPGVVTAERRANLANLVDLTELNCFSIDSEEAKLHEDMFSIEPREGGGYRVGIHIVNAPMEIPYGSAGDVFARQRGRSSYVEIEGGTFRFQALPSELRLPLNMAPGRRSECFSLLFDTDDDFRPIENSYQLVHAAVRNNRILTREDIDGGERKEPALERLERFASKNRATFGSPEDGGQHFRSRDLVRGMMQIFNDYAGQLLTEAGIAVPAARQTRVPYDVYKFTGPARDFDRLISQRQLDSYLRGKPALSDAEIREHAALTGTPVGQSLAYAVLRRAEKLRGASPDAPIRVTRSGQLVLHQLPPEGKTSFKAPADPV